MRRALTRLCTVGTTAAAGALLSGHAQPAWHAAADAPAPAQPPPLPVDKLACHRDVAPPRAPAVLVSCGSFNPPTVSHLRMFDLATAALAQHGYDVWGCYMSPVADAYGKQSLAPARHRLAMARLAAENSPSIMVDAWEAAQPGYTCTLQVLRHVASSLQAYMQPAAAAQQQQQDAAKQASSSSSSSSSSNAGIIRAHGLAAAAAPAANLSTATADRAALAAAEASTSSSTSDGSSAQAPGSAAASSPAAPRVMLLCGADLLATINTPGVWQDPDIILQEHGIVCVCRAGTDVDALLQEPGSVLQRHRQHVVVVQEPVANDVSSTMVRQLLAAGQPVRYLVPDAVLAYIEQHQLFAGEGCAMMR